MSAENQGKGVHDIPDSVGPGYGAIKSLPIRLHGSSDVVEQRSPDIFETGLLFGRHNEHHLVTNEIEPDNAAYLTTARPWDYLPDVEREGYGTNHFGEKSAMESPFEEVDPFIVETFPHSIHHELSPGLFGVYNNEYKPEKHSSDWLYSNEDDADKSKINDDGSLRGYSDISFAKGVGANNEVVPGPFDIVPADYHLLHADPGFDIDSLRLGIEQSSTSSFPWSNRETDRDMLAMGSRLFPSSLLNQFSLLWSGVSTSTPETDKATASSLEPTRHIGADSLTDCSKAPEDSQDQARKRKSLLMNVKSFYAICRLTTLLAANSPHRQHVSQHVSQKPSDIAPETSTNTSKCSGHPAHKRKIDDDEEGNDDKSDECQPKQSRRKLKQKETSTSEFACWWFVNDPERYHSCRNYCSRNRDLHSFRRHHFEDHWRWGDVEADGVSFETWKTAKHAVCDRMNLSADARAHHKWKRTYRIYFGLKETDPVPSPVCADSEHIHHRPKRPVKYGLPPSQHGPLLESFDPSVNQVGSTVGISQDQTPSDDSFLGLTTYPQSDVQPFPEISLEELLDPVRTPNYLWNDRFDIASDIIQAVSETESLDLVVHRYTARIQNTLRSLYDRPQTSSRETVVAIVRLVHDFEAAIIQAGTVEGSIRHSESSVQRLTASTHGRTSRTELDQTISEFLVDSQASSSESLLAPATPDPTSDIELPFNMNDDNGHVEALFSGLEGFETIKEVEPEGSGQLPYDFDLWREQSDGLAPDFQFAAAHDSLRDQIASTFGGPNHITPGSVRSPQRVR